MHGGGGCTWLAGWRGNCSISVRIGQEIDEGRNQIAPTQGGSCPEVRRDAAGM